MFQAFYPGEYRDSAYEIPYEQFYEKGIRGVIFDLDNTLVPHGEKADEQAMKLFGRLRELGIHTCLLSNNRHDRVAAFAEQVQSKYIWKAGKPGVRGYRSAMEQMGTEEATTLFVGDQLFTDIYGANRAGIYGILVKPIDPREEIQIVLKRFPERIVLYFYKRSLEKWSKRQ